MSEQQPEPANADSEAAETAARASETEPDRPVATPLPTSPPEGTASIRIQQNFPIHIFIPWPGLQLSQDTWTNVPQEQVAEISQLADENQVLLEIVEGS